MPVEIGIDTQGFPLSPGTVDFTSPVHTHAPKGVFAMLSDANDAAGTPDDDVRMAIGGATAPTAEGGSTVQSIHGGGSASVSRQQYFSDKTLVRIPGEPADADRASFNQFLANGCRFDTDLNNGNVTKQMAAINFGGSDLKKAEVGSFAASSAVDTEQTVSLADPDLIPNVVLWWTSGTTQAAGVSSFGVITFGICIKKNGVITQKCFNHRWDVNGAGQSDPANIFHTNRVLGNLLSNPDTVQWELECTGLSKGEMKVTPRVASAGGDEIGYLAMQWDAEIALDQVTLPQSTGTYKDRVGFRPNFVLHTSGHRPVWDTISVAATAGVLAFVMINDQGEEYCFSWATDNGAETIDCQSMAHSRAFYIPWETGNIGTGSGPTNGFDNSTNPVNFLVDGWDTDLIATQSEFGAIGFRLAIATKQRFMAGNVHGGINGGMQ